MFTLTLTLIIIGSIINIIIIIANSLYAITTAVITIHAILAILVVTVVFPLLVALLPPRLDALPAILAAVAATILPGRTPYLARTHTSHLSRAATAAV